MRPKLVLCFAAAVVVSVLVGCASEADRSAASRSASTTAPPIVDEASVNAAFGERLEELGLHVTRAGLTDRDSDDTSYGSGDHLAVYVEPLEPLTSQQYLDRLAPLVELFVPAVFERTPRIKSFDLCQEPSQVDDAGAEPVPVTAFLVERSSVDGSTWRNLDLASVIRLSRVEPRRIELIASPEMVKTVEWMNAVRAAQQ